MLTDEQKANRKNGLGASDSPIIMGYSTYKTPYQLYLEKVGLVTNEEDDTELQYWGKEIEPLIIRRFAKENDVEVTFPDTVYHPDYPFIFANLDGFIPSENAVVEAKMVNSFQGGQWDLAARDGIPLIYLIQIAKQVAVMNADLGYCAVLIGGNEYQQFIYERDKVLEELIIQSDIEFWDYVVNKREPDPINTADCRLKYCTPAPDKIANATYSIDWSINELNRVKAETKRLAIEEDKLKMNLMTFMGSAEYLTNRDGQIIATWKATKKGTRMFTLK